MFGSTSFQNVCQSRSCCVVCFYFRLNTNESIVSKLNFRQCKLWWLSNFPIANSKNHIAFFSKSKSFCSTFWHLNDWRRSTQMFGKRESKNSLLMFSWHFKTFPPASKTHLATKKCSHLLIAPPFLPCYFLYVEEQLWSVYISVSEFLTNSHLPLKHRTVPEIVAMMCSISWK